MSKPAIKEWLAARQALPSGASSKPLLLRALEKYVGDWREPRALNPKDYLQDGYNLSQLSIAKMRQILSQYNIDYPERPSKPILERVLSAEMALLRQANGIAHNDPSAQDLAGSLNQMGFTAEPNQTQEPQYEGPSRVVQQQQQQQAGPFGYRAPSTQQLPAYDVFVSSSGYPALRGVSATTDQVVQPTSAFAFDWNNYQPGFRTGGPVKGGDTILQPNSVPANAQQTGLRLRPSLKSEAGLSTSQAASKSMYEQHGHQYHTSATSFRGQTAPSYPPAASGMSGHNPSKATRVRFSQPLQSTTEGTEPTPIPEAGHSPSSFYEKSRNHLSQQPAQPGSLDTSNHQPYASIPQSVPHTFGQPSQMGKAALPQNFNVPKSSNVPADSNGFEPNTTASSHQQAEAANFREWISNMLENRIPGIAGTANSIDEVETMFYEIVQSLRRGERE